MGNSFPAGVWCLCIVPFSSALCIQSFPQSLESVLLFPYFYTDVTSYIQSGIQLDSFVTLSFHPGILHLSVWHIDLHTVRWCMDFDKCTVSCIHHNSTIWSNFTALKILSAWPFQCPLLSKPLATIDLFALSIVLSFPKYHLSGIYNI